MTPKEKAQDLYNKFEFVYIQNYTSKHEVKQCALIAVDEIIQDEMDNYFYLGDANSIDYWQEVKEEINKI